MDIYLQGLIRAKDTLDTSTDVNIPILKVITTCVRSNLV